MMPYLGQSGNSVLVRPRVTPDPALRLLCFPYAGGGPTSFFTWIDKLPSAIEPVLVQMPGRAARFHERLCHSVAEIGNEVAASAAILSDVPWAFYGHSLGGLIAFEVAGLLQRAGVARIAHLFAGAALPPHALFAHEPVHRLPPRAFLERLQHLYSGIPEQLLNDPELLEIFLPVIRADMTMFETYSFVSHPPLDCPITAFAGDRDRVAQAHAMHGWSMHTRLQATVRLIPGGHFFIADKDRDVIEAITESLGLA